MSTAADYRESARDLRRLADLITSVPAKLFDQNYFSARVPSCGTSHCVAGWAATIHPWLILEGGLPFLRDNSSGVCWKDFKTAYRLTSDQASILCSPARRWDRKGAARALRRVARIQDNHAYELETTVWMLSQ